MAAYGTEGIPSSWDNERDTAFFRITSTLFSCEYTYGAGVLLASYDDELEAAATFTTTAVMTATPTSAVSPTHHVTAL